MDSEKIRQAVRLLIEAIGEDAGREGLLETPDRIVRMMPEILGGAEEDVSIHFEKTFAAPKNEPVYVKDMTFYSVCEHHFLPFFGHAHVGYIPDGRVLGLSKIERIVGAYARRPQLQERLTAEIAGAFVRYLKPAGVIVALDARHLCMEMRGVRQTGARTFTVCARGVFETDGVLADRFLRQIGRA